MKIFTKEQLIADLQKIKSLGPVKNTRGQNNGASGNVLEDLLGIEENNLPLANAAEWEIKSKKKRSNALITLFHSRALTYRFEVCQPDFLAPLRLAASAGRK